jgi:hypothetical protein
MMQTTSLTKLATWALAGAMALSFGASYLLDVPSDMELERATQLDLQDAINQAHREAPAVRVETTK